MLGNIRGHAACQKHMAVLGRPTRGCDSAPDRSLVEECSTLPHGWGCTVHTHREFTKEGAACSCLCGSRRCWLHFCCSQEAERWPWLVTCDPVCWLLSRAKMFYNLREWLYQLENNCSSISSCVGDFSFQKKIITVRKWVRKNSQHAGRKARESGTSSRKSLFQSD